ncbi:MAG: hypothetical protein U1F57_05260 [bacterium]
MRRSFFTILLWFSLVFPAAAEMRNFELLNRNSVFNPNLVFSSDEFTVTQCPDHTKPPQAFKIDCSKLGDSISKANCPLFIQDVACKVYPVYRTLTDGVLEKFCPVVTYRIFRYDNWPAGNNPTAGGQTDGENCRIDYHEGNSVNPGAPSAPNSNNSGAKPPSPAFGAFARDTHEILHQIQYAIDPALVGMKDHPFFDVSMHEAAMQLGATYKDTLSEAEDTYQEYSDQPKNCPQAEDAVAASLYAGWLNYGSKATNVVKDIYANLMADPEVLVVRAPIDNAAINPNAAATIPALKGGDGKEVDRVLVKMTGGKFKTYSGQIVDTHDYLIQHGCPTF